MKTQQFLYRSKENNKTVSKAELTKSNEKNLTKAKAEETSAPTNQKMDSVKANLSENFQANFTTEISQALHSNLREVMEKEEWLSLKKEEHFKFVNALLKNSSDIKFNLWHKAKLVAQEIYAQKRREIEENCPKVMEANSFLKEYHQVL